MSSIFEIHVALGQPSARQSGETLYRQLRDAIVDGRLVRDAKLPSTRDAATPFGVSRTTRAAV